MRTGGIPGRKRDTWPNKSVPHQVYYNTPPCLVDISSSPVCLYKHVWLSLLFINTPVHLVLLFNKMPATL